MTQQNTPIRIASTEVLRTMDSLGRDDRNKLKRILSPRSSGIIYALIALALVLSIITASRGRPAYLSDINVQNIMSQSALLGILAVFITVVLITGNFDLSVASTAALGGTVALMLIDSHGAFVATVAALGSGVAIGLINGFLVQKVGVNAFIVTLGTMTAIRGLQQVILEGQAITAENRTFNDIYNAFWTLPLALAIVLGMALVFAGVLTIPRKSTGAARVVRFLYLGIPGVVILAISFLRPGLLSQGVPVWIMLFCAVVVALLLRFTVFGRNVYAVGSSSEAARLSGINVDRYKIGAFVLTGISAAGVGILYAGQFNSIDVRAMSGMELTAITAAILGGTSLFGGSGLVGKTVAGAILLVTLVNGFDILNIGSNYQSLVQGAVLIAAASLYMATSFKGRSSLISRISSRLRGRKQ